MNEWNWEVAENDFKQAIKIKPNFAEAHLYYTWLLGVLGRIDEAGLQIRLAQELDPSSITISVNVSFPYYWNRQFEEGIIEAKRALALDPTSHLVYWFLGICCSQAGHYEKAIAAFQNAIKYSGGGPYYKGWLGHAFASVGYKNEALQILDELKLIGTNQNTYAYQIALIYLGFDESQKAMEYIERAFEERNPYINYLKIEPYLDPLRKDPKFEKMLLAMGLH